MTRQRHPSPVLFLSVQSVNFVDRYQLEKNINLSILQTEERVKEIDPVDLYRRSNPALFGDYVSRTSHTRRLGRNGMEENKRLRHFFQKYPRANYTNLNTANNTHNVTETPHKKTTIHFLTEGHAFPRYREYGKDSNSFQWTFDRNLPGTGGSPQLIKKYTNPNDNATVGNHKHAVKLLNIVPPAEHFAVCNDDKTHLDPLSVLNSKPKQRKKRSRAMNCRKTPSYVTARSLSPEYGPTFTQQLQATKDNNNIQCNAKCTSQHATSILKKKVARLPPVAQTFPNHTFQGCKHFSNQQSNCSDGEIPCVEYRLAKHSVVPPLTSDVTTQHQTATYQPQWQTASSVPSLSPEHAEGVPFSVIITGRRGHLRPISPIRMVAQAQLLQSPYLSSPDDEGDTPLARDALDHEVPHSPGKIHTSRGQGTSRDSYVTVNKLMSREMCTHRRASHLEKLAPLRETTMENIFENQTNVETNEHHVILPSMDTLTRY
jgi:hypothetical protein